MLTVGIGQMITRRRDQRALDGETGPLLPVDRPESCIAVSWKRTFGWGCGKCGSVKLGRC